jgi:hypothetical protein
MRIDKIVNMAMILAFWRRVHTPFPSIIQETIIRRSCSNIFLPCLLKFRNDCGTSMCVNAKSIILHLNLLLEV